MNVRLPLALTCLALLSSQGHGETFVQADVSSRVVLAFRANATAVQRLLPAPWRLNPLGAGPSQGANLLVVFFDRAVNLDAEGKPLAGGVDRYMVFAAPATNPESGKSGAFTLRILTPNGQSVPGPYKVSELASVSRQLTYSAEDTGLGTAEETWLVRAEGRANVRLAIRYQKALPSRAQPEIYVYSAVEPTFYRIYRVDQGTDVVKSRPANVDRLLSYEAKLDVPEFKDLLDGTEELVSVAIQPWYVRRVFLP